MISKIELEKLWLEISPQFGQNVGRRADPSHPLDFFITYDEKHNMQLMLLSEFQPGLPHSSKQIYVRGNKRTDGKYAVCFSLEDNRLKDQYISLCWDIMDCTFDANSQKLGTKSAIERFTMWQKLFAEGRANQLSDTEVSGLIGELTILKDICIKRYGINKAISGWVGPLGADRDFEFEDTWFESKFVSLSMDKVKISSVDQLDTERDGFIVLCRAEKTALTVTGHVTLNSLINDIVEKASSDENALISFKNRLALSGYDASDDRATQPYMIHRFDIFSVVDNTFPRIRRSEIHTAIADGEYQLSISALQQWITELN